jgi:hypothetical protein
MYGIRGVVSNGESDEVTVTKLKMSRTHALRIEIRKTALKSARPLMTTQSNHNFLPRNPRLGAYPGVDISQPQNIPLMVPRPAKCMTQRNPHASKTKLKRKLLDQAMIKVCLRTRDYASRGRFVVA